MDDNNRLDKVELLSGTSGSGLLVFGVIQIDLCVKYVMEENDCDSQLVINRQPSSAPFDRGLRRPIPISTVDWQSSMTSHIIPLNGLDFLRNVNKLVIQQTVELTDLVSHLESENRYIVKIPGGETIYYGNESSTNFQRTCFGSSRAFTLRLYDHSQQEAMQFKRRLACGSCSFWCHLQQLEVWLPPGEYVGYVGQDFHPCKAKYTVYSRDNDVLYRIIGPNHVGCLLEKHQNFQIYNPDCTTQIGSIINQWDQMQVAYNLFIQMPGNRSPKHKALLLGAAFLLEYMYFENSKRRTYCKCMC